jgi:hypothetical protein
MKQADSLKNSFYLFLAALYRRMILIQQFFSSIPVRLFHKRNEYIVFCIGFSKTGTTSLHHALNELGYKSLHWPRAHIRPRTGWIEFFKKSKYDAFSDSPLYMPSFFKELDKEFPNSKFIFTPRNPESLVKSWKNYFGKAPWSLDSEQEKNDLIKQYNDHKEDVLTYFSDKPSKLLVLDILGGEGWEKLCSFLDKPIPDKPFPRKRVANYSKK